MNRNFVRNIAVLAVLGATSAVAVGSPQIEGVFGFSPIPEYSSVAVWVPLSEGEAVSGVRWYNNDGDVVFPEVLAVAGDFGHPELLVNATVVGEAVVGATLEWSEYFFAQAIASETDGVYLIFRIPLNSEFNGEGAGFGLGYCVGSGENRCWVGTDAETWNPVTASHQMAVEAIMANNKNADVLVLRRVVDGGTTEEPKAEAPERPVVAGMSVVPNPFNPQTEIRFALPQGARATLAIFDIRGRKVRTLVECDLPAGEHLTVWEGRDDDGRAQPSGVYLAKLSAGALNMVRRLTLLQ